MQVMVQTGEAILQRRAVQALNAAGSGSVRGSVSLAGARDVPSGDVYHITMTVQALDAASLMTLLERNPEAVGNALVRAERFNKGSTDTSLRGALRLTS